MDISTVLVYLVFKMILSKSKSLLQLTHLISQLELKNDNYNHCFVTEKFVYLDINKQMCRAIESVSMKSEND